MKIHFLKIDEKWFGRVKAGEKTCEIRFNDHDFQAGDKIKFEPVMKDSNSAFTNDGRIYEITHVLHFPEGLKEGYVALSIKKHEGLKVNPPR